MEYMFKTTVITGLIPHVAGLAARSIGQAGGVKRLAAP